MVGAAVAPHGHDREGRDVLAKGSAIAMAGEPHQPGSGSGLAKSHSLDTGSGRARVLWTIMKTDREDDDVDVQGTVVAAVAVAVVSGWTVFYVNGALQRRADFRALKDKVDSVAGRHATVLWEDRPYKIESFDRRGIVLRSKKQSIFIPTQSVIQRPLVVPSDDYDRVIVEEEAERRARMRAELAAMADQMIDEWMPRMMAKFQEEIISDGGEINYIIGLQIRKALDEGGFKVERRQQGLSDKPPGPKK